MFLLQYHMGWSFIEAYNLAITIRRWYLKRLQTQFEKEAEETKRAQGNSNPARTPPKRPPGQ